MRIFSSPGGRPTDAERVRTILASAQSMTVLTDGARTEVSRHSTDGTPPRLHLHPAPATSDAPDARTVTTLEFTDIAPLPTRSRVRARLTLTGRLLPPNGREEGSGGCLEFGGAVLTTPTGAASVSLDELLTATPDPLATCEAGLLTHLADGHGNLVPLLLRLVEPCLLQRVRRAVPLALDRYGVTLRLEYPLGHHDVRLPFRRRLHDADQFGAQLRSLLATARRASHRSRLFSGS
ncbi:DUF2470 domain-containing protein [Streptomyces catenulae]|uniref:DUF2470 domain-containing protein n=1 Tax=Streptomyces catenulae TaxID=66875 RepID=A0ABV2YZ57_9ACTN|nr:DUF2470 domain-containing protein [Streptomyces catenulae]